MFSKFPLFPEQASTVAGRVDTLFLFLIGVSVFFGALIAGLLVYFGIRYRRRRQGEPTPTVKEPLALELAWTLIPLAIVTVVFLWSAQLYVHMQRPPRDAMEVFVVGKRWMWKIQHMTGQREINQLHVPVGTPVKLTLTSEDVIHSFFVPAFRVKKDVVPGRYNTTWFQATKPGRYHLFCAEYCGTKHSAMIGEVIVMEPADFQAWLSGATPGASLATVGQKLFTELACATCHKPDSTGRGPVLTGVFGNPVKLGDGETVIADEGYLRESIATPAAKVVEGYQPVMPSYQGLVSEEGLAQLVAYIESLRPAAGKDATLPAAPASLPGAAPGQTRQPAQDRKP